MSLYTQREIRRQIEKVRMSMSQDCFGYNGLLTNHNPFKVGDKVTFTASGFARDARTVKLVDGNFVNISRENDASGWWRHDMFKKEPDIYDRVAETTGYARETVKRIATALGFSG